MSRESDVEIKVSVLCLGFKSIYKYFMYSYHEDENGKARKYLVCFNTTVFAEVKIVEQ